MVAQLKGSYNIKYHDSEKSFYSFINRKNLSKEFEEFLWQIMRTLTPNETPRSKKLYYKDSERAVWNIHLPNSRVDGKNAFRMLCVIDTQKKTVVLGYLFSRKDLPFKGSPNKKWRQRWNKCVSDLKEKYF